MIKYLFLSVVFSLSVFAVEGKGQFETKDGDSIKFVKKQLFFSALRDVIDKEFDRLGLEKEKFWMSFDEKFNEKFSTVDESLKTKYKITEETPMDDSRYTRYNEERRKRYLRARRNFWKLNSIISSYSVSSLSQSITQPGLKYMTVKAKLNESLLRSKYYRLLKNNQVTGFSNLYLKTNFKTSGFSWDDLNVDQNDFKSVVNNHWTNWLTENYSESVNNVVKLDEGDYSSLNTYLKELDTKSIEVQESEYTNSLLLEVNISFKEVISDDTKKSKTIEVNLDSILVDLNVNKIIGTSSIQNLRSKLSLDDGQKPGSVLASFTYNKQVEKFSYLKREIASYSKVNNLKKVKVTGHRNLLNIHKLITQINVKGIRYRMKAELESFTQDNSTLIVFFSGDDKILDEQILMAASGLGEGIGLSKVEPIEGGEPLSMLTYNFNFDEITPEVKSNEIN